MSSSSMLIRRDMIAPTRIRGKINKCVKKIKWTPDEDERLFSIMLSNNRPNYTKIADFFPGKTGQQIAERWDKVLNPNLIKGSWTKEEDQKIINFVNQNGTHNWGKLASLLPGRIGKQCRERWRNHLDPNINHNPWTHEEDDELIRLHQLYGNAWVKISLLMKNRSDNDIKNRWNSTIKKRLQKLDNGGMNQAVVFPVPKQEPIQPTPPVLGFFMPLSIIGPKIKDTDPKRLDNVSPPSPQVKTLSENRAEFVRLLL